MNFKERPLSWSAISSWEYNKEQWAKKYLDNIKEPANPAMLFGHLIGQAIAQKHSQAPKVPHGSVWEYKMVAKVGNIPLLGYADSFEPSPPIMDEYKTHGVNGWSQKRVDEHGQFTMYALLLYLQDKIHPKDLGIRLSAIPVRSKNDFSMEVNNDLPILTFETKRTMADILRFGAYIKAVVKDMKSYEQWYFANKERIE